jgi:hypothetical protein
MMDDGFLPGGAVAPAHVSFDDQGDRAARMVSMLTQNHALRIGWLCGIHYPGEEGYEKNRRIVYDVLVPNGGDEPHEYYLNCRVVYSWGYRKDVAHQTLRSPQSYRGPITPEFISSTTPVLITCASGNRATAYILGALEHEDAVNDLKANGHNLHYQFNGMDLTIDKDGAATITYNGATVNPDGTDKQPDANTAGTHLQFDKEGRLILNNAKGEKITIDTTAKTIAVESRAYEQHVTDADWQVTVKGKATLKAGGDVVIESDGRILIGSDSASQNLVLGKQLVAALGELVQIFTTTQPLGRLGGPPGPPVVIDITLLAKLTSWRAKYAAAPSSSPLLSKDNFTE